MSAQVDQQRRAVRAVDPDAELRKHARCVVQKGGIGSFLSWARGEPIMIVYAVPARTGRGFAIQRSRIGLYVDEKTGAALPSLVAKAGEAARHMGIDPLDTNINEIVDVVMHQVPDLRAMPDAPPP